MTSWDDRVFLLAANTEGRLQLYSSAHDGTASPLSNPLIGLTPKDFIAFERDKKKVFAAFRTHSNASILYGTDGSSRPTQEESVPPSIDPQDTGPTPSSLSVGQTLHNNSATFTVYSQKDVLLGRELALRANSNLAEPILVDIFMGPASSQPEELTALGSKVFFPAEGLEHGSELFTSDGTATGTHLVQDLRAGRASSRPRQLTVVNEGLYFIADTIANGETQVKEGLWTIEHGETVQVELKTGASSPKPRDLLNVNRELWFVADSSFRGPQI